MRGSPRKKFRISRPGQARGRGETFDCRRCSGWGGVRPVLSEACRSTVSAALGGGEFVAGGHQTSPGPRRENFRFYRRVLLSSPGRPGRGRFPFPPPPAVRDPNADRRNFEFFTPPPPDRLCPTRRPYDITRRSYGRGRGDAGRTPASLGPKSAPPPLPRNPNQRLAFARRLKNRTEGRRY